MDSATLAQNATEILAAALPFIYAGANAVVDKSKDMLLEKGIEKVGSEMTDRAKSLMNKISPKMSSSLEKALENVSKNPKDSKSKKELQHEILRIIRENPDLAREIGLIVNINLNTDLVKQIIFGDNHLILSLEGLKGEELIKVMEYLDWKRKETMKEELSKNYSPSSVPQYTEDHIKFVTLSRAGELSQALKCLHKNKLLLFSGIAGVGKTTLARVLLEFRPASVSEPFWFSFQHNQDVTLEILLEELAGYLQAPDILSFKGARKAGKVDINRLTDELMKRDSVWLVFDDLNYILDTYRKFKDPEMGLLFSALHDNTHRAKIILTSRVIPIQGNGERLIDELEEENKKDLKGLETSFAVDYLKANGLEKIEYNTLRSLSESVDGHPFSLKLLIGLAKRHTLENVLKNPEIYKRSKEERIKNAKFLFDKLAGNEKELLERISVFRKPEPLEAINVMLTDNIAIDAIDTLLDKSLLETDNNNSYWLHPLVQEFSYKDLKNRREVHHIAYSYYTSLLLPQNSTKKEDFQPAIEAHHHACEAGEYNLAALVIRNLSLHDYLDTWGDWTTLIALYRRLLPDDPFKDKVLLSKEMISFVFNELGSTYRQLGYVRKAIEYHEYALKIAKEIADRSGEGKTLGYIGNAYRNLGDFRRAIGYYKQTLEIAIDTRDRRGEGIVLGNIGNAYHYLGDFRKAIEYYERALKIAVDTRDRRGEGIVLGNMGLAYNDLGESRKAIEYYEQALRIAKDIGYSRLEGSSLGRMGSAYCHLGEFRRAIEYYEQALKIAKETGYRLGEGANLGNLGSVYHNLGEFGRTIEYYKQALVIAKEIGDKLREGKTLGNMGLAYSDLGEFKRAIKYYEQALKISQEISDRLGEGKNLGHMGLAYNDLGEPRRAIEYYEQALIIAKEIGDKFREGKNLGNIGLAYSNLAEPRKAIEYYDQALKIAKEIEDRSGEGIVLGRIGLAYYQLGETKKAISFFEESLAIGETIEDPKIISFCKRELEKLSLAID